ncbi:MAG: DUF4012 domain-containing protein [Candidatus Gracilibacteria bacterium]
MARRVVRDIEKKGPQIIVLGDQKERTTRNQKPKVIGPSGQRKKDEVRYFHIDESTERRDRSLSEALRMIAAGTLVLIIFNIVNIYHRGLSLKNELVSAATVGYEELMRAGDQAQSADFGAAELTFSEANNYFESAMNSVAYLRTNQEFFFTQEKTLQSIQGVLDAARNIASAGQNFSRGVQNLEKLPTLFIEANSQPSQDATRTSLTEKLKEDLTYVNTAIAQLKSAQNNLNLVSEAVLPAEFRSRLASAKAKLAALNEVLAKVQEEIPALLDLLGDRYPHRYLVLLQNDTEARPTGGFIGSYVIMDLNDGYLTKMDFHDVYELDGQLQEYIEPPSDIKLVSDNWRMRDSNYSPDFAISAEKAAWFLQKQKGPSVDTVIAINQSFIADLMELTGPIQLPTLDQPLTKDNFQLILSYIIESKLSGAANPKEIMQDLVPAFQSKLLTGAPLEKTLEVMMHGIDDKKILFYSRNERVQQLFDDFGLTERVRQTAPDEDYLNVIATSVGGNKSDRYIDQNIKHYSLIQKDGSIVNEVTVTRKHTWTLKDLEGWRTMLKTFGFNDLPPHIQDILGSGENKAFVKIYVPEGSELIQTEGFPQENVLIEDDKEIGKRYFMVMLNVPAGEERSVSVTYKLPYKLRMLPADSYKLHIQKQAGMVQSYLEKRIFFKAGLQSYKEYPAALTKNENGFLEYTGNLTSDLYLSSVIGM